MLTKGFEVFSCNTKAELDMALLMLKHYSNKKVIEVDSGGCWYVFVVCDDENATYEQAEAAYLAKHGTEREDA